MEFVYSYNTESEEPIVLLNKHIGNDDEDGMGIDDAVLQAELFQLDTMGKKRIKMLINSPGGLVMGGYNIIAAMQKTNTPIDTYCVGMCASIAGIIFQCGRKRYMADYGILMYHNPYSSTSDQYSPLIENMRKSLNKIMCEKTGMDEQAVKTLMDRTSYIGASDAYKMKLCDVVESSVSLNTKYFPKNELEAKVAYKKFNEVVNKLLIPKSNTMLKVVNKLKLNEAANEDQIVEAINSIENRATKAETELAEIKNKLSEKETEIGAKETELTEVKNKLTDAETQVASFKKEKEDAELATKKANAKNLITEAVRMGRIKNEAALLSSWIDKATSDFDGTKQLLEAIPATKKSEAIKIENKEEKSQYKSVAQDLAEVQNRLEKR